MTLRLDEYLRVVANGYDYHAGFDTKQQRLLRDAATHLAAYGPADFIVKGSGGQKPLGTTPTPWIGFFDPDESTTPMRGLYVVWILQSSGNGWTLSLNMGTEKRALEVKATNVRRGSVPSRESMVRDSLRTEATTIRRELPSDVSAGWDATIDLQSDGTRQLRYESACILSKTYPLQAFPDDANLTTDLDRACLALQEAVKAKRKLAVTKPGSISTTSATVVDYAQREPVFAPGRDQATTTVFSKESIKRSPRHEGGLRRYGIWLQERGFRPATNVHPRDFVIPGSPGWLGEYKVVYGSDVARATREAHSQLKEYSYFLYDDSSEKPGLLAVFSSPITDRRVAWLNAEGIAVVWDEGRKWKGCPLAQGAGLAIS
ncbi:MrcB family domain-containing protein [Micromonospora endolithica]|uniref:MrcB family domain-containing protein n=1 Tax=Micromonospora endolithica TaxID=230091 RepID=UPI0013157630|nr:DUF3578 domain-containing protein [Micromonospora endolithica]